MVSLSIVQNEKCEGEMVVVGAVMKETEISLLIVRVSTVEI